MDLGIYSLPKIPVIRTHDSYLNADKNKEFFGEVAKPKPKKSKLDKGKD